MRFKSIALRYARMGFPVFPLVPREKFPAPFMKDWPAVATTDEAQIAAWDAQDPSFNCGLVAKNDGFVILEFDVQGGMRQAAAEMGETAPKTRNVSRQPNTALRSFRKLLVSNLWEGRFRAM